METFIKILKKPMTWIIGLIVLLISGFVTMVVKSVKGEE